MAGMSFNLVIEILFFSSSPRWHASLVFSSFNLVIEILFFSSASSRILPTRILKFQSRNRDTFLFKNTFSFEDTESINIVAMFQSRNRDTFLFKLSWLSLVRIRLACFNLVIEILFFSYEIETRQRHNRHSQPSALEKKSILITRLKHNTYERLRQSTTNRLRTP